MFLFSKIFKYVWPEIKKYKLLFYSLLLIFSIRVVLYAILSPFYFKKIIDTLSLGDLNRATIADEVFKFVYILIILNIFVLLIARGGKFLYFIFEINMIRDLRNFAFQKIEQNSHTFFANTFAGSLVTKTRRFVGSFEIMFDIFIYNFLSFFIVLAGVFIVLTKESPKISLIFMSWVLIHIVFVCFFVGKKMKYDALEAEQDSKISGRLSDVFGNILAVKFFSARDREINSFSKYTDEGAKRSRTAWFFGGKIDIIQGIFVVFIQSLILYIMVNLWLENKISTGTVVLIQTYMIIVFDNLWNFGNALTKFMKSASDMKEMIDIFEKVPDILDPEKPEEIRMEKGHIVFNNVSFSYNTGYDILHQFNLDIKPGEHVGVIGHSGAGKSTITKLILRFNDIKDGSITIDGQDIRNVTQEDLRRIISYVPQEPILFHRPIKENIAYGKSDASIEEIIDVSKKANAHEFISKLHQGYDTFVGERGVKLSGGERQRVAIARAILKDSPVLVLDEATSSLDSVSEFYIQQALDILMEGKTTLIIAHRLSTIQKMDRIIVLDKGTIVEEGTHKELLAKKGMYDSLWNHQTGGFME